MIPVSLSGGVEPGARTGTSVNGQPVVVWRGRDGAVRAWADQCPHRGMRLSFGSVRENTLTCIYHGWTFGSAEDASGGRDRAGCLAVPAHPGLTPPAKAVVRALPVTEALGMIWVGTSADDTTPPVSAGTLHPVRSVTVPAPGPALRTTLEATPPPGTRTATHAADGSMITFDGAVFDGPAARVIAAIQERGDGTSAAHVVSADADPAVRKALCGWAALVRDHLTAVVLP